MDAKSFFSKEGRNKITDAVQEAELNTSGEIRVHIEGHCKADVLDRAAFLFKELKMHKTELRNGVLFYLAINDHKFAILGDAGINKVTGENFWGEIKEKMQQHFKKNHYTEGLVEGIEMAGQQLKEYFPYQQDDVNELSDEISFGKK